MARGKGILLFMQNNPVSTVIILVGAVGWFIATGLKKRKELENYKKDE